MEALGKAEQLVREAEAAADSKGGEGVVRGAWDAVRALKEARRQAPHADPARDQRSPLYVRAVQTLVKAGQWAEARRLASHIRFDRDPRLRDRIVLRQVVEQANRELGLASPPDQCDLIMKGGITSGIVYPRALGTLSEKYTFRRIAGTSVGAVAAAAAAAAEYSRQHFSNEAPSQGFQGLEKLPEELGATEPQTGHARLLTLFQPQPETKHAMDVALAVLGGRTTIGKVLGGLAAVLKSEPLPALIALVLSVLLVWFATGTDQAFLLTLSVLAAFATLALGIVASAAALLVRLNGAITANGFGICRGYSDSSTGPEPLTNWLTTLIDRIAGLSDHPHPLTFGDLWGDGKEKAIDLVMTTTNITFSHPHRLPFLAEYEKIPAPGAPPSSRPFVPRRFFFSAAEFARLFPPSVCDHMVHCGEQKVQELLRVPNLDPRWRDALPHFQAGHYLPFPDGKDLPVVVGARMSLSFPVLLSMVPLYAVDETLEAATLQLEPVWFSDGGSCSNLPIHFFDAFIPDRPTFAINLVGETPTQKVDPKDQARNVWMPSNNLQGLSERWSRFGGAGLWGFFGALLDTTRNWVDWTQMTQPGYRDRIVHIRHTSEEGGLNLTMSREHIAAMSVRGEKAGERILQDFDWDNHLWIRLRSVLDISDTELLHLRDGPLANPARRALFLRLVAEHTGAEVAEDNAPITAAQAAELPALLALFEELLSAKQQIYADEAAPDPTPELRVRPQF